MSWRLQVRKDTAANWTSANPILLAGEIATELDTGKWKLGNGVTAWNSLTYAVGAKGETGDAGATWLSGSVDPTTEGVDGDYYLNTTTYDVFKKASGSWTVLLNIKGPTGLKGDTGAGVLAGGTAGQVLSKINEGDYNTQWVSLKKSIAFYIDDILEVGTNLMSIIAPQALTIIEIRLAVDTAPTGAALIIDINKNGTTLYTAQDNRPTIADAETSATAILPNIVTLAVGDKLTLDIDQVGSTVAGENLSVIVICEVI